MRAVFVEHFRIPYQNCGSELMMHHMALFLKEHGHECVFITTDTPAAPPQEACDGMECYSVGHDRRMFETVIRGLKPDVVVSHHQRASLAIPFARRSRIPSVYIVHNNFAHSLRGLMLRPDLTVFNTSWIQKELGFRARKSIVVHPPVFPQGCQGAGRSGKIALINVNKDKGGEIFYRLAQRLPSFEFLAVVGAHGNQVIREDLPNVEIQPHTSTMCPDVWSKTGLLLIPSIYESYGMVGLEAASCGIPAIASPTPGLKESLGSGGEFINRDLSSHWEKAIRSVLADDTSYQERSDQARVRFSQIDPKSELEIFLQNVEEMVGER